MISHKCKVTQHKIYHKLHNANYESVVFCIVFFCVMIVVCLGCPPSLPEGAEQPLLQACGFGPRLSISAGSEHEHLHQRPALCCESDISTDTLYDSPTFLFLKIVSDV